MRAHRVGIALVVGAFVWANRSTAGEKPAVDLEDQIAVGRELFLREWVANDPRSRAGDGLGPVYNAASCVACHHIAGAGGAGGNDHNVQIVSPFLGKADDPVPEALKVLHPDFRSKRSIVVHRFGTSVDFPAWRARALNFQEQGVRVTVTQRNTPHLFGAGRIESIPEQVIEAEATRDRGSSPIHGRVARLPGGRIGRFGWKAQAASLGDFVRGACAVELGLEVPGHSQAVDPTRQQSVARGLDMSKRECDALIAYLAFLPEPQEKSALNSETEHNVAAGRELFANVGCASCHVPKLGRADGVYSDLLLHDMGQELSDVGAYYGLPSADPGAPGPDLARIAPPTASEWRTPPLWGLRDSGPYLHDGRAKTIAKAIALHGGEARDIAKVWGQLSRVESMQLQTFLLSLAAPPARRGS
jgi:CxxC motif-containing protein (DUF1111 family)